MQLNSSEKLVGSKVKSFYEKCSFPGYEEFDSLDSLIVKAETKVFAKMLNDQIPPLKRIIDFGCGTGQLAIYLSLANRRVIGADFSFNSLKKAELFRKKQGLDDVSFIQMDLFKTAFKPESFDFLFCLGVLHHTADPRKGFRELCKLVKKNGYIIVGLYNKYARLLSKFRRFTFQQTGDRFLWLDYFMRSPMDDEKKKIWFQDQYMNPHESSHTVDEVMSWFEENKVKFVNSLPKTRLGKDFDPEEKLFKEEELGGRLERFICQLLWIFTLDREGGYFLMIGQKE